MAVEQFGNQAQTTLSAGVNASALALPVTDNGTAPFTFPSSAQFRVRVDDEIMLVTAGAGTTSWTVTRGAEGTTAASHSAGARVYGIVSAGALQALANATSTTTKRATATIAGDGTSTQTSVVREFLLRQLIALPVTTTRWRLRIRNYSNTGSEVAGSGSLRFRGAAIATPDWSELDTGSPSGSRWKGRLSSDVAQVLAAATLPSDASDYTTEWVTDSTKQFTAGQIKALSLGYDTNGLSKTLYQENRGLGWVGVSSSPNVADLFADSGSVNGASYVNFNRVSAGDIRLEYEWDDPDHDPRLVVAFIGDSITSGATTQATNANHSSLQAWPAAAALRRRFVPINMGVGGTFASDWTDSTKWKWGRFDLATTVPDLAVIGPGTNDVNRGDSAATIEGNLKTIADKCRAAGIAKIAWATIVPRSFAATPEAVRVAVNDWMRDMPYGAAHVFDLDKAIALQATPASADAKFLDTAADIHPKPGGHQKLANAVDLASRR